jgi:hypothetical protein
METAAIKACSRISEHDQQLQNYNTKIQVRRIIHQISGCYVREFDMWTNRARIDSRPEPNIYKVTIWR